MNVKEKKPEHVGKIYMHVKEKNRSVRQKYTAWISEKKNNQCHKQNAECKRKVPSVGKNKLTRDKYQVISIMMQRTATERGLYIIGGPIYGMTLKFF